MPSLAALLVAACGDSPASGGGRSASAPLPPSPAAARNEPAPEPPSAGLAAGTDAKAKSNASGAAGKTAPQLARPADPRYRSVAAAIEAGDAARARREWLALPPGLHAQLLNARLLALEGDAIGCVREIEAARASHPDQGAVYSTAAEIHAAAGRLASAEDEIREGLVVAGETPELLRARGVLSICREGGALKGLGHLLEAKRRAPDLEFMEQALVESYRLLGAAALSQSQPVEAAAFAREALAVRPGDPEMAQMLGDSLAAQGDFDGALAQYESVLAEGVDVRAALAMLSTRGATAALLESKRELAVARYLRARELGATDEELGFGAHVLSEEFESALRAGFVAYEAGEFGAAARRFEAALVVDPRSIEARNHLGVACFKLGEFERAAQAWRAVLAAAEREALELPEPVHLNLARALYQLDRRDELRTLLVEWLEAHESSEHADATREMLARLEAR